MRDGVAFVADDAAGVLIVDVSNPQTPVVIGGYDTPGNAEVVVLNDSRLYIADQQFGLQIVHIGSCLPCAPDLTGDGVVDTLDFLLFLGAWAQGNDIADWDENGTINTMDFIAFLNEWAVGC